MIQNYKPQRSTEINLFYQTKIHLMELNHCCIQKGYILHWKRN